MNDQETQPVERPSVLEQLIPFYGPRRRHEYEFDRAARIKEQEALGDQMAAKQKLFDHLTQQRDKLESENITYLDKLSKAQEDLFKAQRDLALPGLGEDPHLLANLETAQGVFDAFSAKAMKNSRNVELIDDTLTKYLASMPPTGMGDEGQGQDSFERPAYASPSEDKKKAKNARMADAGPMQLPQQAEAFEPDWMAAGTAVGLPMGKAKRLEDGSFEIETNEPEKARQYEAFTKALGDITGRPPRIVINDTSKEEAAAEKQATGAKRERGQRSRFLDQRIDAILNQISQVTQDAISFGEKPDESVLGPLRKRLKGYEDERKKDGAKEFAAKFIEDKGWKPPLTEEQRAELKAAFDAASAEGE